MTKLLLTLSLTLSASAAFAAETGVGYGGSVGALTLVARDVATSADDVRRQGGFATAGAVHWIQQSDTRRKLSAVAF